MSVIYTLEHQHDPCAAILDIRFYDATWPLSTCPAVLPTTTSSAIRRCADDMSFRFGISSLQALDGRAHREEDLTSARRAATQRKPLPAAFDSSEVQAMPKTESPVPASPSPQRRHVVFADPVAFRYLEEDPSVEVVARRGILQGYELYLVEQWACSRQSPTLVIVTYTGDTNHSVVVGVLGIPADEKEWSPRLKIYFKAIQQYHARPKETPLGELMVTNLSSFPSALTVISVPDGDIRQHRQAFIVNEDLKRLGCSGRSGMTLAEPTKATQDKFMSLYKTSDRNSFSQSVLELIKLCQLALFIFGELDWEYIDGLLCDVTEKAINDWWTEIGSEYFIIEPTDGILGPTTVAALLGTLMGARNRLSWYGAPVGKDVFDIDNTKRAIGSFQKACKLERTRRLDYQTLRKLHTVSAKAATGDGGWGVQKAVKSTVEGFGGKRGELVIGMVGGKDKANMGDIETLDIDRFIGLAAGERAKWLWHGKPRRSALEHHDTAEMANMIFGREEAQAQQQQPSRRVQSLPLDEAVEAQVQARKPHESSSIYSAPPPGSALSMAETPGDKDLPRRTVFKSVAGKVNDARSGFGRFRDAVGGGLRGHAVRPSRDETPATGYMSPSISTLAQSAGALSSPVTMAGPARAFTWKNKPEEYADGFRKEAEAESAPVSIHGMSNSDTPPKDSKTIPRLPGEPPDPPPQTDPAGFPQSSRAGDIRRELVIGDASVAGSVADEGDLQGPFLVAERSANRTLAGLQRRHSINLPRISLERSLDDARWPHRLSFSAAEEAVLGWEDVVDLDEEPAELEIGSLVPQRAGQNEISRDLYHKIDVLQQEVKPWLTEKLSALEALDEVYGRQQEEVQSMYYALGEAFQRAKLSSEELIGEERAYAAEAVKDIEILQAKLEYEINALASKVEDVEDGVRQFEMQVEDVESRAEELKVQLETESWPHFIVRTLTGIGTGPNLTGGLRRPR